MISQLVVRNAHNAVEHHVYDGSGPLRIAPIPILSLDPHE